MQISEIRIKLVMSRTDRLKAFCTVTFDNQFVVRDLKIIEGADGFFVAMPSRKLTDRCPSCGSKNALKARYCSDCGSRLSDNRARRGPSGRTKLHADVAHPVNSEARHYIQSEIVKAYNNELELSKQPGYKPVELGDDYEDDGFEDYGHDGYSGGSGSNAAEPEHEQQQQSPELAPETANRSEDSNPQPDENDDPKKSEPGFGEGIY